MTPERNSEHLRFLSDFYTNTIETQRINMTIHERQFLADRSNINAYHEWLNMKTKICELYTNWLKELDQCDTSTLDDVSRIMHLMMSSDCYWFLAKMNKPAIRPNASNYANACDCLEAVFSIIKDTLKINNPFYQHLISKYEQLVADYRKAVGKLTLSGTSKHVPATMTEYDIYKCKHASRNLKQLRKGKRLSIKCSKIATQLIELSKIMINNIV